MSRDMTGTMFDIDTKRDDPNHPTAIGKINIDGVTVNINVYPARVSLKGNVYYPIKLRYPKGQVDKLGRIY